MGIFLTVESSRRLRRKGAAGVLSAEWRPGFLGVSPKCPFFGSFFRACEKMNNNIKKF